MRVLFPICFLLIALVFCDEPVQAQNLTGIWKGYFVTERGEQYRLEFQVQQGKAQAVTGVSYSYLDKRFYGKASMTGNYVLSNKSFQIQETRTTEVRNLGGGGTCLMNYKFLYSKSGKEEFLEGTYLGKTEDRKNPKNNGVWGDCGGGKVYLRRVEASDFYVEPFLRDKPKPETTTTKKTTPPVAPKKSVTKQVTKTPATKPPATAVKKPAPKTPATNKPIAKKTTALPKSETAATNAPVQKAITAKPAPIPQQTRSRENQLVKTLIVTENEIVVKLYDNGEIDGDTISVYLDNAPVLSNKRLTASPLTITLKMDEGSPDHVLVMVAENLGRIPPNTSLMIVHDGDKRYEVRITSTEQKNAMVYFRYQKKNP